MYDINDLKNGTLIELNDKPYLVLEYQHSKLGRGSGIMRTKLKDLNSGSIITRVFKGEEKIEPADVEKTKAQYLYADVENYYFMDNDNYEQFAINKSQLGDRGKFLQEGGEATILYYNSKPINIELPIKMTFKITDADPSVRGNTKNAPNKNAILENGLKVQVPIFIKAGDNIIIDTRTGTYIERSNPKS
jgi:elongation factor P